MSSPVSGETAARYADDGCYFPVDVFEHVPRPTGDLTEEALVWHDRILTARNEAMFEGADRSPA